jgi:hypothetical protein
MPALSSTAVALPGTLPACVAKVHPLVRPVGLFHPLIHPPAAVGGCDDGVRS